ncbi:hypothetical protein QL285_093303 [Trifolium repens]|nr:hypothetical protein QL285_093303 [Trifolium repens]
MVYNEQRNVDEKCDDVAGILPGKENANIKTNSLEMVLIDAKGGKIQASVKKHVRLLGYHLEGGLNKWLR